MRRATASGFRREAEGRGETVDGIAFAALRALRHKEMGRQLAEPLRGDEHDWLDADLGDVVEADLGEPRGP